MKIHIPIRPILEITALDECMDARFAHPYYFQGEFHPFWELVYVLDGKLQAAINENVYTLEKGDMLLYRPMEFHRLWSVDNADIHAFIVGFSARGDLLSSLENGAYTLTPRQQQEIEGLLSTLHSFIPKGKRQLLKRMLEHWQENIATIHIFINSLGSFLIQLAGTAQPLIQRIISNDRNARLFRAVVAELNASLEEWISTEEIARRLHCSPAQINRVFARFSDVGVHKYLLKLKIAAAIRMLRQELPVSEVSAKLAFSNQNYFSTVFKRETGFSPSQYAQVETEPSLLLG